MKRIRNALNLLTMSSKMKESNGLDTVDIPSDAHDAANYPVDSDVGNENASSNPIPYAPDDTTEHKSPILASKNTSEQNTYLVKETQYVQGLDEKYQLPPPTISKPTSWDNSNVVPSATLRILQPSKATNQSNSDVVPAKRRQFPPPPPPIRSSSARTIKKASTLNHTENVKEEQPSSSSHPTNRLTELKSELYVQNDEKDAGINVKEGRSTSSPQMRKKVDQKQSQKEEINDQEMLISQQVISGNHETAGKPKIVGLIHKTDITHSNSMAGQSGEANCNSNETSNKDSALPKNSSQDPVSLQSTSLVEQENQHPNYKKFLTHTHVKNEECSSQQTKPIAVDKNCSDKVQSTLMDELSKVTKRIANAQNKLKTSEDTFSQYDKGETVSNSRLKSRDTRFAKPVSSADTIKSESVTNSYKSPEKHSNFVLLQKYAVENDNQAIQPIARTKEDVNVFETAETRKFTPKTRHEPKLPLSNHETTAIPSESENSDDQGIQFVAGAENQTNADLEHDNVAPEQNTPQNLLLCELKKRNAALLSSSSTKEHNENTIQRDPVVLPSKSVDSINTQGEKTNDFASQAAQPNKQMAANTVSKPVIAPKPPKKNQNMETPPLNPPAVETDNTTKDEQTYRPTLAPKPLPRRLVPTANNSSAEPQVMSAQISGAKHIVADSTDQVTVKIDVKDGISDQKKMLGVQGCVLPAIQTTNTNEVDTAEIDEILAKLNEELNSLDELCKQSFTKKENE